MRKSNRNQFRYVLWAMVCMAMLWMAQPSKALVISEIMYHPADPDENLEFIEFYNNRAVTEPLAGCFLVEGVEYTFGEGAAVGPKQYIVVARDPAALEAAYGIEGVYGPYSGRLSNGGEQISLANENGEVFLSASYADEAPWPVSPDGAGHSLIRAKLSGDPEEASSWSASSYIGGTPGGPDETQVEPTDPTLVTLVDIGHPGLYFKGTREPSPNTGGQATTAWAGLDYQPSSADWLQGPGGYGYSNDSAELAPVSTILNDMNGNYLSVYARLSFSLTQADIDSFSQLQAMVYYDDGFVLYLNGTRVGDSGQLPGTPPAFNQVITGSATDYGPISLDLTGYLHLLVPGTNVLAVQGHNASLSGSSDFVISATLRAVQIDEERSPENLGARVLINELLANSDAAPGLDWIELYNPGPVTANLSHAYLSDDPTDLLKFELPGDLVLEPGQFWAVSEGTSPESLPFALDYAGETVYLTKATAGPTVVPIRVMDAVRFGASEPDVSFGRFPDGAETFGFLTSATYGASNSWPVIDSIVINELMYHHPSEDERYEYVELYNRSDAPVSLAGWAFTDGIDYTFEPDVVVPPNEYLVVAEDPNLLVSLYDNLAIGINLFGPYSGNLNNHSERVQLSRPLADALDGEVHMVAVDEVTYYDGGHWPKWADGGGASLELRDPNGNNDTAAAWADSIEDAKTTWVPFSFSVDRTDTDYTHDTINLIDMMLLNPGEVLLDDLEVLVNGTNVLTNGDFESGASNWRLLGNHVRSRVTTAVRHSGSAALHLIATGHGDPGANRINQSISSIQAGSVTFQGWARWVRGNRFLLMRTVRTQAPVQPPRPAHSFELEMPMNLGTPGQPNTTLAHELGPVITDVKHSPVLPAANEPIVVTAHILDPDGVLAALLTYQSEGQGNSETAPMVDDGTGDDLIAGDGIWTGTIPGAPAGTMRSFRLGAISGSVVSEFPTTDSTAVVSRRNCLVRVGDTQLNTRFATYRIWLSNDTINVFRSRSNLSNELTDCTFVYNDTEVFYNVGIRFHSSPWLRGGSGWDPRDRHPFRLEFGSDQKFRYRTEINLDTTEGSSRGPLQERTAYWFFRQMGLPFSMQEYIRPIINGRAYGDYEDVQKIDGDYVEKWFPGDSDGYLYEIDDYFEFDVGGTSHSNLQEGIKYDSRHPLIKETYRWGVEKRSHSENDDWDLIFGLAVLLNTPSSNSNYEMIIDSIINPRQFAAAIALRHAVGDWDTYGYTRGKNCSLYYAPEESQWYLIPWDIDFAFGSGDGSSTDIFRIDSGQFPEVYQFLNYPKYRQIYLQVFADLVNGPWKTSYGTNDPPTEFDLFIDEAADALVADGLADGRRNAIKSWVRSRRDYILMQLPDNMIDDQD